MAWVSYDAAMNYESGIEGLAIYLPTEKGTINYNFVHTVNEDRNVDMWRLSVANLCDKERKFIKQITKTGAEWEMAIRLSDRSDFIGGYAHGDEKLVSLTIIIDEVEINDITTLSNKEFSKMLIKVYSKGFDPNDGITKALEHCKEYMISDDEIELKQTVRWCNDYQLDSRLGSYLAMMPPMKYSKENNADVITDLYYTDIDAEPKEISTNGYSIKEENANMLCVLGKESRLRFKMSKEKYSPKCNHNRDVIVTDNGERNNYNKMYFVFAKDDTVATGDIWNANTVYQIEW